MHRVWHRRNRTRAILARFPRGLVNGTDGPCYEPGRMQGLAHYICDLLPLDEVNDMTPYTVLYIHTVPCTVHFRPVQQLTLS